MIIMTECPVSLSQLGQPRKMQVLLPLMITVLLGGGEANLHHPLNSSTESKVRRSTQTSKSEIRSKA